LDSNTLKIIAMCVIGYLLGSIPSGVWIGKLMYGKDVRDYGSGNMGTTNTFRVLGKKAGIIVLVMDMFKGTLTALLPMMFGMHHRPRLSDLCRIQRRKSRCDERRRAFGL